MSPPTPSSQPRRFLAPEVIQTSAMDCGPAALKCLLEGFGIGVSYGRLREACQTSVDGTSIDTLEALAVSLGLEAEQVMMPVDHLLLKESDALPAIVVVRMPSGLTHFVVVWRIHGGFVQVMDPARGRRWIRRAAFLRDVYVHNLAVAAEAFSEWAGSDGFTRPLARRLREIGIGEGEALVSRALADRDWSSIAALDRAARTVAALVASGALERGAEARRLVETLASSPPPVALSPPTAGAPEDRSTTGPAPLAAAAGAGPPAAPSIYATATPAPPAADGTAQVSIRGAVLLRVAGARSLPAAERAALPVELRAAVDEPRIRVGAELARLLAKDGLWRWGALAVGVVLTAFGTVTEAVLFRTLIDFASGRGGGLVARAVRRFSGRAPGQGTVFFAIVLLLIALLAVELPLAGGLRGAGRRLEERLRRLFLHKIPRLPDRYFQSRPVSDMAERAHLMHRLRALPTLGADVARTALEIVVIAVALAWLYPGGAALALGIAAAMLLIPFLAEPIVAERDLRMRNHGGALGRFYLDGLIGLISVRTHGAEPALAREHRDRLREWVRAARTALGTALAAEAAQSLVGFGLAVWLLVDFFAAGSARGATAGVGIDPGTALLVVYWALSLPALGQELALFVQQIPPQRNLTLRLVEPLGAPEEGGEDRDAGTEAHAAVRPAAASPQAGASAIRLDDVRVVAGGRQILEVGALEIAPGEHLAIVGASGAGKSSLVGLLLGWHHPATGQVRVDGALLDGAGLEALRRRTVWIDPSVYLWNRSLAANLIFGLPESPPAGRASAGPETPAGRATGLDLAAVLELADLDQLVRLLPRGLDSSLGEAGALVSGGEGQRVRFGRGLLRADPRLVILDEPFRGLSREQRGRLLLRARERWSAATLICVTHDIQETASFSRVLVIADGQIAEDGAPAALLARPGSRYRALADAERRVMATSWSDALWRRVRLEAGRVGPSR
jgi:ABC-type bacteriocin/lantibiotic exporter with double-glycine peptidase domain